MVTLSSLLILHLCTLCQFFPNLPVLPSSESMSVVHISPQTREQLEKREEEKVNKNLKTGKGGEREKSNGEHQLQGGRGSFLVKTRIIYIQGLTQI